MDPERWERVKDAFSQVVERGPVDAYRALLEVCGDDHDLRRQVQPLIDEHFRAMSAARAEARSERAVGDLLAGRFRIMGRLGIGTFGEVYRVFDQANGSEVALKVLRSSNPAALAQFKREFRSLADIRHDNIIALYELLNHADQWMFSMELVDGVDFRNYLDDQAPADRDAALRSCLGQIAEGLQTLHRRGLIHRDLKPSNVMVTRAGRLLILDFGLVRAFGDDHSQMTFAGTPEYMAPEQATGAAAGAAADWYALGVMLYQVLTGELPFDGHLLEVLQRKQVELPRAPRDVVPDIPVELDDLCARLLEREPSRRASYQHVIALAHSPASAVLEAPTDSQVIGRDIPLERLAEAYRLAQDHPVLVHLCGPSGMGKTALLGEFIRRVGTDASALVFAGRCYESESVPYQALDDLVDQISQHLRRLSQPRRDQLLPRQFGVLARLFPVLTQFQSHEYRPVANVDGVELRTRAFTALGEMIGRFAERHRLVLVIDDLQWGEADGCAALTDLLSSHDSPAMLVVLSYRSEDVESSTWLTPLRRRDETRPSSHRRDLFIDLDPLDQSAALSLAASLATSSLAQEALHRIVDESDGMPFLIHEMVRWLNDEGPARAPMMPFDLGDVVRARVEELDDDSRSFLTLLCVAGQPTALAVFQATGRVANVLAVFDRLISARLVRSRTVGDRDEVEVYHDRIRTTVLGETSAAAMAAYHRSLADGLLAAGIDDPERVATHLSQSNDPQLSVSFALRAAQRAADALAFNKAASLFELALSSGGLDPIERGGICERIGDARANAGRGAAAAHAYLDAAAANSARRIVLTSRAAGQLLRCGYVRQGTELFHDVLNEVGLRIPRDRLSLLAYAAWLRLRVRMRGLRYRQQPLASARAALLMELCWSGAMGNALIDPPRCAVFLARHLLLALPSGDPHSIAVGLASEAMVIAQSATGVRDRRVDEWLDAATELADRIGDPRARAFVLTMRSGVGYLRGQWTTAIANGDAAAELLRSECSNVAWEISLAHIFTFVCRGLRGEWPENARRLPMLVRDAEARGDLNATLSLRVLGCAYVLDLVADRPDQALRQLREDVAAWPHENYDLHKGNALMAEVDVQLYCDRPADAWNRLIREWPTYAAFRMPGAALAFARGARGRAALALAAHKDTDTAQQSQLLSVARADARALTRKGPAWSRGLSGLLRSGVAAFSGDRTAVYDELRSAENELERADLRPHMMAAMFRRSAYAPAIEREHLRRTVRDWATQNGVVRLDRIVATLAPGGYPDEHFI